MNEAAIIALINQYIIANGNNEITGPITNTVLQAMVEQINDKVGELANLSTADKTSIVNAINELVNSSSSGFDIHAGANDPNVTPPSSYGIGDWYLRNGTSLYQHNGQEWVLLRSESDSQYTYIDNQRFNYTIGYGNSGNSLEVGDIASSGSFMYQSTLFFGDLICVDNTGDTSTGIGTTETGIKWKILNAKQIN